MINLHERMLPTSAGVEPATSWSPVGRKTHLVKVYMSILIFYMYKTLVGYNREGVQSLFKSVPPLHSGSL